MLTWLAAGVAVVLIAVWVYWYARTRADAAPKRAENPNEGTTLASNPPPMTSGSLVSISTEIEISTLEEPEPDESSPSLAPMDLAAAGQTDAGRRRKHNEDAYLLLDSASLFVIADGMGGYAAGEVASQLAIDVMRECFEKGEFPGEPIEGLPRIGDELVRAIQAANQAILNQARANSSQAGMGTTLVSVRFSASRKRAYIAHVGDSRLYRMRRGSLYQLTVDHTLAALGIQGPSASKLSRAVGVFDEVEVDLNVDEPQAGDFYMLCSDGLSKMVPEASIAETIRNATDHEEAVRRLVTEANERGGKDNVTVVLIRVAAPMAASLDDDEPAEEAATTIRGETDAESEGDRVDPSSTRDAEIRAGQLRHVLVPLGAERVGPKALRGDASERRRLGGSTSGPDESNSRRATYGAGQSRSGLGGSRSGLSGSRSGLGGSKSGLGGSKSGLGGSKSGLGRSGSESEPDASEPKKFSETERRDARRARDRTESCVKSGPAIEPAAWPGPDASSG